jgi:polysaccharide export outer membrane protein
MTHTQQGFKKQYWLVYLLGLFMVTGSGCSNPKQIMYFNDVDKQKNDLSVKLVDFSEVRIAPDDLLEITIETLDPENTQGVTPSGTGSENTATGGSGFLVDKNGYIELPVVGRMKVAGFTLLEAKEKIRAQARQYFKEPLVNVRLANFRVTVLGEVRKPGTAMVPFEKAGLLDVIGLVGDVSETGNKTTVMLIREEEGMKKFVTLDLTKVDVFKSPYYYTRPGDVIYVEPIKARARVITTDPTRDRYVSYLISAVSLTFTILAFIRVSQ